MLSPLVIGGQLQERCFQGSLVQSFIHTVGGRPYEEAWGLRHARILVFADFSSCNEDSEEYRSSGITGWTVLRHNEKLQVDDGTQRIQKSRGPGSKTFNAKLLIAKMVEGKYTQQVKETIAYM